MGVLLHALKGTVDRKSQSRRRWNPFEYVSALWERGRIQLQNRHEHELVCETKMFLGV